MSRGAPMRALPRLVLAVGGEAAQSGFHFGLNLVLLHMLSARDYGIFALVMVIGGVGLTYVRSLTAMPASVMIARSRSRHAARAWEMSFGSAVAALSLAIALGVGLLLLPWLAEGAFEAGCFVALWALRSHIRTVFFALRRTSLVGIGDAVFVVTGLAATGTALWLGGHLLRNAVVSLAFANALAIAVLLRGAGRPVRISFRGSVWRRCLALRRQLGWSLVGVTVTNLQGQGVALLVGLLAGPAAYAPIAAVLVLFVPLRVAATAFVNVKQPELAGLIACGSVPRIERDAVLWSVLMGIGGLLYGAAMLAVLPLLGSPALQGQDIEVSSLFAWAIYTLTMLYVMPRLVLEALLAFRTVAAITAAAALIGMGAIVLIIKVAPPIWSLSGGAASEMIVLVASWLAMRRHLALSAGGRPPATDPRAGGSRAGMLLGRLRPRHPRRPCVAQPSKSGQVW